MLWCKSRSLLLYICFLLLIPGCGYTIQGKASLPFQTVKIGKIVNRTYELKLEDRMQRALAAELLKTGFSLGAESGYSIEGVLNVFELRVLSVKVNEASEYEVIVKGDFRLYGPSGQVRTLRSGGIFITSFLSTEENLTSIITGKELATERALRDFSSEIVASILSQ